MNTHKLIGIALLAILSTAPLEELKPSWRMTMLGFSSSAYGGDTLEEIEKHGSDVTSLFLADRALIGHILSDIKPATLGSFDQSAVKVQISDGGQILYLDSKGVMLADGKEYKLTPEALERLVMLMYKRIPSPPSRAQLDAMLGKRPSGEGGNTR